ncbi:MAG: dihydrofolate reductase family protein [Actinomycetota bacterium]
MRTLTYFVAQTADGFIAGPDGSFDFFPPLPDVLAHLAEEYPETIPTHARDRLGVTTSNRHFDVLLQGRVSYQIALDEGITSPYAHVRQYVLSRTLQHRPDPEVEVIATDPCQAVRRLKDEPGDLGICLIGGAQAAGALLPEIDELLVKRYPVVAGAGLPMFAGEFAPVAFEHVSTYRFDSGADFTRYARVR